MNKKILIIRFGSLGDIILTSATVLNITCHFPDTSINYLTKEKYRSTVEMIDGIDEILTIDDSISAMSYFKFLNDIDSQFDIIFDLHGNFRSWMARKILSAERKLTYPKRRIERTVIVKNKVLPENYPHTIDLYNQTLRELDKTIYQQRPLLKTKLINNRYIEFFQKNTQVIVVVPGASYPTKQYDPKKFAEVAVSLHQENEAGIIWADANFENTLPQSLDVIPQESFLRLTNIPIQELASVIEKAHLTITNDSGIAHLSSGVSTPVISIFGPTHPVLGFAPRGIFDQVIQVPEECRPCSLHGGKACYREEQFCFSKIEPERILKLAIHKLENSKMSTKAVFLDRDGTLIQEKNYLSNPNEIEIIDGAVESLKMLQANGYKLVVVSNQSGVARGKFSIESVEVMNRRLSEMLSVHDVYIDAFYYCPHHPSGIVVEYSGVCNCRKPALGMIEEAILQLEINPRNSFVVGDKLADINLGKLMGGKSILVRTGYGKKDEKLIIDSSYYNDVFVCDSLKEVGEYIVKGSQ